MSKVLDVFKIKPFDLQPIYDSWTNPPLFQGNPKKDPSVDDWLDQIQAGCIEHKVPEEYWHKVAQHYMVKNAKERMDELKVVLAKMHGGKYRWNWKKFKIAMNNMGWELDANATEAIKVQSKPSGIWWITRKNSRKGSLDESSTSTTPPLIDDTPPKKTESLKKGWETIIRPVPVKSHTDTTVMTTTITSPRPPLPTRSNTDTVTNVAHAPIWLLNATNALDFLTSEHPKVMTALGAILITCGSIPAMPGIAAGGAGVVLASGAAQAVGAIAVGVGSWIKATQEMHTKAGAGDGAGEGAVITTVKS